MKYEYTSIVLGVSERSSIDNSDLSPLNDYYDEGWEFVDSVAQVVAYGAGSLSGTRYAPVVFTLRKKLGEEYLLGE